MQTNRDRQAQIAEAKRKRRQALDRAERRYRWSRLCPPGPQTEELRP